MLPTKWVPVSISRLERTHDLPIKFVELVKHLLHLANDGDDIQIEEDRGECAALRCWRVQTNLDDIDLELTCQRFGFQKGDEFVSQDLDPEYDGEKSYTYSDPDIADSEAVWWLDQIGSDILIHDC